MSERRIDVLRAIVRDYVSTREPVGSQSIARRYPLGVSAATIRNDMAALEADELIAAQHTSSGRIPTDKGYRLYVDHLSRVRGISAAQRQAMQRFLDPAESLDDLLERSVRVLSSLTGQVALVQAPSMREERIRHVELVELAPGRVLSVVIADSGRVEQRVIELGGPTQARRDAADASLGEPARPGDLDRVRELVREAVAGGSGSIGDRLAALPPRAPEPLRAIVRQVVEALGEQVRPAAGSRLVMAGTANLVRAERDFTLGLPEVLSAIEEQVTLLQLFAELHAAQPTGITIGHENEGALGETSVLSSAYELDAQGARIAVLGPTRMDHAVNLRAVHAVAAYLTRRLGDPSATAEAEAEPEADPSTRPDPDAAARAEENTPTRNHKESPDRG